MADAAENTERGRGLGRALAWRHEGPGDGLPHWSLLDYAESPRTDDWTLRSALVRLAQPEPVRVSATLELIRRCDAALKPYATAISRHPVACDRELTAAGLPRSPASPCLDARATDLARLLRECPDVAASVTSGYAESNSLADEELMALPLLVVALDLDLMADALTAWSAEPRRTPPLSLVDDLGATAFHRLDRLEVPRQTGRPPTGSR